MALPLKLGAHLDQNFAERSEGTLEFLGLPASGGGEVCNVETTKNIVHAKGRFENRDDRKIIRSHSYFALTAVLPNPLPKRNVTTPLRV
jgi:hypothetical protein